jgi:hypothetical protein
MNLPPDVGTMVITHRPPTNQPWVSYVVVAIVEAPDGSAADWGGRMSEAEYLYQSKKVKTRAIDQHGMPSLVTQYPRIADLIPTDRTKSFTIDSLADIVAAWDDPTTIYDVAFARAGGCTSTLLNYWELELLTAREQYPPRFGVIAGAAWLGQYDRPWLGEQWDVWYTHQPAGLSVWVTLVSPTNANQEVSYKGQSEAADGVWHRVAVWKRMQGIK